MAITENFEISAKQRRWSLILIGIGVLALILGFATKGLSADEHQKDIFWGTLMYNSLFFMLICNASMFFICASTLAMGGWYTVLRRIPEATHFWINCFYFINLYCVWYTYLSVGRCKSSQAGT
jgi:hypothetical protein